MTPLNHHPEPASPDGVPAGGLHGSVREGDGPLGAPADQDEDRPRRAGRDQGQRQGRQGRYSILL